MPLSAPDPSEFMTQYQSYSVRKEVLGELSIPCLHPSLGIHLINSVFLPLVVFAARHP